MICKMGWESLSDDHGGADDKADVIRSGTGNKEYQIRDHLFYPLSFPVTTGGGAIAVLFTLSAHSANDNWNHYLLNTLAILAAIVCMCVLIFLFYSNTRRMIKRLGANGEKVVNRKSAFLIFCVGLQIAITGIKSLFS